MAPSPSTTDRPLDASRSATGRGEAGGPFRLLFERSPVPMWFYDVETFEFLAVNDAACEQYGYTRAELLALRATDIRRPEEVPSLVQVSEAAGDVTTTARHLTKDGRVIHVEVTSQPLSFEGRRARVVMARDITERMVAAAEISFRQRLVEAVGQAVVATDADGTVRYWNQAAEQFFGWPGAEATGRPVEDVVSFGPVEGAPAVLARLLAGDRWAGEVEQRRRDGSSFPSLVTAGAVRDDDGGVVGVVAVCTDLTEQKRADAALRESERLLAEAQRIAEMGSWSWEVASDEVHWSDELNRIYGMEPGTFGGTFEAYLALVHPDDRDRARRYIGQAVAEGRGFAFEGRIVRPNGEVRMLRTKGQVVADDAGRAVRMTGICHDVTGRKLAEEALQASEERFRLLAENAQDLVYRYRVRQPAGFEYVSPASVNITGYTPAEYYENAELGMRTVVPEDADALAEAMTSQAAPSRPVELRLLHKDGSTVWVELRGTPLRDEVGDLVAIEGIARDITERKRAEEELAHQALHDPLTGLPNRTLFMDRLEQAVARLGRRGAVTAAVLFLDLDQFKIINDSLSHQVGDDVLVAVGSQLRGALRPGDTVARFGGDEFAVLCEDVCDVHHAIAIADRIGEAVRAPLEVDGRDVSVTTSIGIALAEGRRSANTLLRDADAAMYRAKERGRDRCEVFDEGMRVRASQRLDLEQGLRAAIERDEFVVVYQPVYDLATRRAVSVEALVRWKHPERGMVGPTEFIPVAEESGLIVAIGANVLHQACRQAARWRRRHPDEPPVAVSVNLSARQLGVPKLYELVRSALWSSGLDASLLCLEITESAVMDDAQSASETLSTLRDLGVSLAIDDFGTGYSSLGYLKRFPVDALKVDRAFVDGLGTDPEDSAIVEAVVGLGRALGVRVVAEGVETRQQLAELRRLGCDQAQGNYFAWPGTPAAVEELIWGRPGPMAFEDPHQA